MKYVWEAADIIGGTRFQFKDGSSGHIICNPTNDHPFDNYGIVNKDFFMVTYPHNKKDLAEFMTQSGFKPIMVS